MTFCNAFPIFDNFPKLRAKYLKMLNNWRPITQGSYKNEESGRVEEKSFLARIPTVAVRVPECEEKVKRT